VRQGATRGGSPQPHTAWQARYLHAWHGATRGGTPPPPRTAAAGRDTSGSIATGNISPPSADLLLQLHDTAGDDKSDVPGL
jgi:hypothetical protein